MLSFCPPPPPSLPTNESFSTNVQFNELGSLQEAVETFTDLTLRSETSAVRLHCSIPTWVTSTDTCLDLHDLHELRSRLLLFVHDLIQSLRASGIAASYTLSPSHSSLCTVSATSSKRRNPLDVDDLRANPRFTEMLKKKQVVLVDLESGPCLIIT